MTEPTSPEVEPTPWEGRDEEQSCPAPRPSRVHVVGPIYFDLVFSGLSSPPRPGTEVRAAHMGLAPGGVANIAIALARLGLDVALSSVFAEDAFGQYLWSSLLDEGVDLAHSVQVPGWSTPVTSSVAIGREREMVTYEEVAPVPVPELVPDGYRADALVVTLTHGDPAWLAGLHRVAPLVFADAGWDDEGFNAAALLARLAAVDVFLPNAAEALAYTRSETVEQAALKLATDKLMVVVKDGASGSLAVAPGSAVPLRAPAVAVDALDTTGAGDVFDAAFIYATLAGWPLARRLSFANLCAAESVKLIGGSLAAPCWRDLAAFCHALVDPALCEEFSFLEAVITNAPARRDCRRSCPAMAPADALPRAAYAD